MEAATHYNQHGPNQHQAFDFFFSRVNPAPDESPNATRDDPDNPVGHAPRFELLDQYHDETHKRAKPGHIIKDTEHTLFPTSEL